MLEEILMPIYIKMLEKKVKRGRIPSHLMVVAEELPETFLEWCEKFGVKEVTVCSGKVDLKSREKMKVNVVRVKGREEVLLAVKKLAELVEKGEIEPEEVNEKLFESFLEVKNPPDLIVRVENEIPDFLIWQSIYSELYFADINLKRFRYVDFLRCLRDYQRRERRYGR